MHRLICRLHLILRFILFLSYGIILIITYVILDKSEVRDLKILRIVWTIGIVLYMLALIIIYVYQIFWLDLFKSAIPEFIEKNKKFIGLQNLNSMSEYLLPIRFLSYTLPYICSIIVRRQINKRYSKIVLNEGDRNTLLYLEEKSLDGYVRWKKRLGIIWLLIDFLTRSNFLLLSYAIIALALHWRLSVSSMIYLTLIWIHFMIVPFMLKTSSKSNQEGYQMLDEPKTNIKELIESSEKEDKLYKLKLISYRSKINIGNIHQTFHLIIFET